ncbi:MAG: CPBP family intramembrane metalloprotease [Candidatus Omnitrophica bacterium]|nr:CPBP family intramembrane metalloprotease [Candidatus Omnitrophota bacterium]
MNKIRRIINDNRMYTWMVIFIILVEAFIIFGHGIKAGSVKPATLSKEEFSLQLDKRRDAFQDILRKDPQVSENFGLLSLFMLALLITGTILSADYISKKRKSIESIPRTLDAPGALWGLGDVCKVVILFGFYSLLFSAFSFLLRSATSAPPLDRRLGMVVSTGFMDLLVLMFALYFVMVKHHQGADALGLSVKRLFKNIAVAICSYVAFLPVLTVLFFAVIVAAKVFNYLPPAQPIYELIFDEKRPFLLVIITILVAVGGPIIEEVFFRGLLYGAIKKSYGIFWAITLSAFCFSILHTNLIGFIPIFGLGIFLAYLREKTGSLVPSITVHMAHNGALAGLMFILKSLTANAV